MANTDNIALQIGIKNPVFAIISKCDEALITVPLRYVFDKYAYVGTVSLQNVIMGPRPNDVPADWVIDHKNRNKLDNTRENLRWVSKSFNSWNCVRKDNRPLTSRFKGVSKKVKNGPEWCARGVDNTYVGYFHTEREAAIAAATSYVRAYGTWAETSDLLFTEDQSSMEALLSPEEMHAIVLSFASTDTSAAPVPKITKGTGVELLKNGRYTAAYRGKYMGTFRDFESAVAYRKAHVAMVQEHEWQAHLLLTPTKDSDGDVVITLSDGKYGTGLMTKVDLRFWHGLTFKRKWCMTAEGYAKSSRTMLHTAVMLLIDSTYVPSRDASIDHIKPGSKLDNRACNLRVATNLEQQRNKAARPGTTSSHLGVSRARSGWEGGFSYTTSDGPQRYRVTGNTEDEVTALLNAKRIEIHGEKAVLGP
jgi:hypothetical protein